jgi:uncharacterized protein
MEGLNVDGKNDSLWHIYYESGKLKAEGYYDNGVKHGSWKYFHPNGILSAEGAYENGHTIGQWKYYHHNGKLSSEGVELEGKKDGYWKLYYETGEFKGEGIFLKGEGDYKEYYSNGKIKTKGFIRNDKNHGQWLYYYEDGLLEGECVFQNGEGEYKGYYEDGSLKMEGRIKDGVKVGIWKLYNKDGSIVGYYKTYFENEKPIFKVMEDTVRLRRYELGNSEKPEFKFKTKKIRYYNPRINEFRGYIVSFNPFFMPFGQLPFSVEYYFQERLGYEVQVTMYRDPFFTSDANVPLNKVYKRGYDIALRNKFYQTDDAKGMLYFGHELRFTYKDNFVNIFNQDIQPTMFPVSSSEGKVEYSVIIGDRFIRDAGKPGITLDIFVGLGLGYRFYKENFKEADTFSPYFKRVSKSPITFPIRLGFDIGYAF